MSLLEVDAFAFARALSRALAATGTTHAKLAEATATTQGYISLLARGLRSPSQETAEAIAAALGAVSLAAFVAEHGTLDRPGGHPR